MEKATQEIQGKNEVGHFKDYYIGNNLDSNGALTYYAVSHKRKGSFDALIEALIQSKNFERPDGYYFDEVTSSLYIFEHFAFDCSETGNNGSTLRRSVDKVNKAVEREIKKSDVEYNSVKPIEQGIGIKEENEITYVVGANGDIYRNNYIKNFKRSYENHSKKVHEYIENCKHEINVVPQRVITTFLIEDVTLLGTYYKMKNWMENPVILSYTKQFLEAFKNSPIDYVIFGRQHDRFLTVCDRSIANDNLTNYIDLLDKEIFIFPIIPKITAAKKVKI